MARLPQYDYLYLGDTKRVPYGNRSQETIHEFTAQALDFLFGEECRLVILACNTASAEALRKTQQEYLPNRYPERRVLGVIIPTVEDALADPSVRSVGVLATQSTVDSDAYGRECRRQRSSVTVRALAAPLLVPLVEHGGDRYVDQVLQDYLRELGPGLDRIVLGCTHYCLLKDRVRALGVTPVVSPDEVVPEKLADYLRRHPEIESDLGRRGDRRFAVTDVTSTYERLAARLVGRPLPLERVSL